MRFGEFPKSRKNTQNRGLISVGGGGGGLGTKKNRGMVPIKQKKITTYAIFPNERELPLLLMSIISCYFQMKRLRAVSGVAPTPFGPVWSPTKLTRLILGLALPGGAAACFRPWHGQGHTSPLDLKSACHDPPARLKV